MLVVANERHEIRVIEEFVRRDAVVFLGYQADLETAELSRLLARYAEDVERQAGLSARALEAIDGEGLARLLAIVQDAP